MEHEHCWFADCTPNGNEPVRAACRCGAKREMTEAEVTWLLKALKPYSDTPIPHGRRQ